MAMELRAGSTSLIDVLDRVLDKGIVIDAWVGISLVGLDLVEVQARVVVASINTYLMHAGSLVDASLVSRPPAVKLRSTKTGRRSRLNAFVR